MNRWLLKLYYNNKSTEQAIQRKENGEVIVEFQYDADCMRIKAEEKEAESSTLRTTYYAYSYSVGREYWQ